MAGIERADTQGSDVLAGLMPAAELFPAPEPRLILDAGALMLVRRVCRRHTFPGKKIFIFWRA